MSKTQRLVDQIAAHYGPSSLGAQVVPLSPKLALVLTPGLHQVIGQFMFRKGKKLRTATFPLRGKLIDQAHALKGVAEALIADLTPPPRPKRKHKD